MQRVDLIIAGGGIIGCFAAFRLAQRGLSVILLERDARMGEFASTRNSGVLHAGIYYEPGSLKARLCVRGQRMAFDLARRWGVAHRRTGKLIVGLGNEDEAALHALKTKGEANGVEGLRLVGREEIARLEPHAAARLALHSPETGIIDAGAYLHAVVGRAEAAGALLLGSSPITAVHVESNGVTVETATRGSLNARGFINACGISAASLARAMGLSGYRPYPVRGAYASVIARKADLVRGLIYPVPSSRLSLGVHLTRTTDGDLLVGPSAERVAELAADFRLERAQTALAAAAEIPDLSPFAAAAKLLVPEIDAGDLRESYFGVRAKVIDANGETLTDFTPLPHPGAPHVLHLLAYDSPGFTSAPAIADELVDWWAGIE